MGNKGTKLLIRFSKWSNRHLSHQQFLMILSAIIGFTAGLGAVVIKNLTHFIQRLLEGSLIINYHHAFYFIFPLIGLSLTLLIIKLVFKKKIGHGIPSTLYAISRRKGIMRSFQMYASIITAPLTVGFGGSVGLEGPTVATGASLGSNISRFFKMNQSSRTLLIGCAAAGAMSSIFKAPIAAIIFAIEVFSLDLTLISMVPLLIASVSAILTSYFFFGSDIILPVQLQDNFTISEVPFYIILGVLAAGCSMYFTHIYFKIGDAFKKIDSLFYRLLIGGLGLGILIYLIPPLYGEGYNVINNLLAEDYLQALGTNFFNDYLDNIWIVVILLTGLVIFKIFATSLTFGAGGIGGIFAPVLFMGSAMGHCFALVVNNLGILRNPISVSSFTMVGMAGLMAGVLHAPLTAIFLIAELTGGYELFVPLMITAAISYMITNQFQPHSVYTMELAQRGDLLTHNKDQAVLTLLNIQQIIEKNFITLNIDMNLGDVIHVGVIKSSRNLFPVIDENRNFLGIILLDDIRPIMFDQKMYDDVKVSDIMQRAPATIDLRKDRPKDTMRKFQETNAWNLPVVEDGKYVGFISKSKLLTAYRQKLIEVTV
ncbi:CIC family chloride channel protein [Salegentibacter mishustinae]|uniref:Chloride channel protein n=2 Tax=Salegentibacter mishustinae TaxID=270918 RepID=A0A0Q9Z7G5_9FLAO|nr:chloride channel protein [Salegentibacter mishustinae]PNW20949.1 chloride channel protein [Salegentibacter mishustinae]PZX64033.1 CIC family chloride channel protein [Salegentibacter mishustinae]